MAARRWIRARRGPHPRTGVRTTTPKRSISLPAAEPTPTEPNEPPLVCMLRELVCDHPKGGGFYQVQFRDRPRALARAVLEQVCDEPPTDRQIDAYMHLLAAGRYNSELYGTQSTSISYPARWLVPGLGVGLRCAWLPRNQDALDIYLREQEPECVVDRKTGAAVTPATSYGLVWCPPVELDQFGEPTTVPFAWSCGASALDPPPAFFGEGSD